MGRELRYAPIHPGVVRERETRAAGGAADKIEQALASICDVSAVLNEVRRPITLCRIVVPLIEKRVECFKHERFIFRFNGLIHS